MLYSMPCFDIYQATVTRKSIYQLFIEQNVYY